MTIERKEITGRLDPDQWERFHDEAHRRRVSKNQAIVQALEQWLGTPPTEASTHPPHAPDEIPLHAGEIPPKDLEISTPRSGGADTLVNQQPQEQDPEVLTCIRQCRYILQYGPPSVRLALMTNLATFEEMTGMFQIAEADREAPENAARWDKEWKKLERLFRQAAGPRPRKGTTRRPGEDLGDAGKRNAG